MLAALVPLFRLIFTVPGFLAWLGLVICRVVLAVAQPVGTHLLDVVAQALSAQNLLILAAVYLDQAGAPSSAMPRHQGVGPATARVRHHGARADPGVPYVDASALAAFKRKWKRLVVSGAGIMVELLLAAIAMIVWVNAEPGLVRAIAFNVMLIGGLSTLLFNGNPLLRFDWLLSFRRSYRDTEPRHALQQVLLSRRAKIPVRRRGPRQPGDASVRAQMVVRLRRTCGHLSHRRLARHCQLPGDAAVLRRHRDRRTHDARRQGFILPAFKGLAFVLSNGRLKQVAGAARCW